MKRAIERAIHFITRKDWVANCKSEYTQVDQMIINKGDVSF